MLKENLKSAIQLVKPELKISWKSYIGLFLFFSIFIILFLTVLHTQENRFVGFDLFYLLLFIFGPMWSRHKGLQFQRISGHTWVSPTVVMGLCLPIKKQTIVLKSIIHYFLSSFPFQLYMFFALYLVSPEIRSMMELDAYISFAIIWLSFGIYIGFSALVMDFGTNNNVSKLTTVLSVILLLGVVILILSFPTFFTYGIVEWTIIIAKKWTLLSAILSIMAAVIGFIYWKNKMVKQFKQVDFL
ncbi:hypothetical protein KGF86_02725 [Ornithinibacillus massiliensis]|uniref:Uncharacterized protein n=1 Tax=Ornithinibacillus massiliensis TaxID=1944633 RepID=A0ABS5M9W5_9BACI|nr:hypothetical protein [Ornithinibacillus massiliensis]MBS3679119.1 hypothetical protein [Ornithinibacillus massiliensis]